MTIDTLLLLLVTIYLVLVAYGVVGARRRGMTGGAKIVAEGLMVVLPPLLIAGALWAGGEGEVIAAWWRLFLLMGIVGAIVAVVAEQVARRVGA